MEYSGVNPLTVDISKLFCKCTKLIDKSPSVGLAADKKNLLLNKIKNIVFCVSFVAIILGPGVASLTFIATTINSFALPLLLGAIFLSLGILGFRWVLNTSPFPGHEMLDNHDKKIEAKKALLHEALQKSFANGKTASQEILDLIEKYGKQYAFLKEWFSPGVSYEEFIEVATAKLANPLFVDVIKNYRMEIKQDLISVDMISRFANEWKEREVGCYSECNDKEELAADFKIQSEALYYVYPRQTHWFNDERHLNFLIPESLYRQIWES